MTTTAYSVTQTGFYNTGTGLWVDQNSGLPWTSNGRRMTVGVRPGWGGLHFTTADATSDPDLITAATLSVEIMSVSAAGHLYLLAVPEPKGGESSLSGGAVLYSDSALPGLRSEIVASDQTAVTAAGSLEITLYPDVLAAVLLRSWNENGRLALTLATDDTNMDIAGTNTPSGDPPTLSLTTQDSFTGLRGGPWRPGIRAVHDTRFGFPAFSNELMRDGDQPGLYVRPEDWDPEDEQAAYDPRSTEGTALDEIPDG